MKAFVFLAAIAITGGFQSATPASARPLDPVYSAIFREASGVGALDIISVVPFDPTEKPTRLQQFVVRGTITKCLKGNLKAGQEIKYSLFSEGKPPIPPHMIVFLRHPKTDGTLWNAVDGPIVTDSPIIQRQLSGKSIGCGK